MTQPTKPMLYWIPLLAGLLPLLAFNVGYLFAAAEGNVDWCVPYWDGCTSVSKVGRKPPSSLLYRGLTIPAMTFSCLFWVMAKRWLEVMGSTALTKSVWMKWLGVLGAMFLIQFNVALGETDRVYRLFRYSGVMFGVGFILTAQILFTLALKQINGLSATVIRLLKLCLWCYVLIGVASQTCKLLMEGTLYRDIFQDSFEWWLVLVINLWFLLAAALWKQTGFAHKFKSAPR